MSQPSAPAPTNAPAANRGVKKGLPSIGLPIAEEGAQKLWQIARLGSSTKDAFARQLGYKGTSGSTWEARIALMRGLKLVEVDGDGIRLSEIGKQIVNDSDKSKQLAARRAAILNLKAYATLISDFDGTEMPEKAVLARRLQFEYGKTEEFSLRAAQAFIDSLHHAEMVDANNVVRGNGVSPEMQHSEHSPMADSAQDDEHDTEIDMAIDAAEQEDDGARLPKLDESSTASRVGESGTGPKLSVNITLDLSNYQASEVIQILRALGLADRD